MPSGLDATTSLTSSIRRILIPHTSWQSTYFWWLIRIRKPLNRFLARLSNAFRYITGSAPNIAPKPYVAPKGPQIWRFPPNPAHLNRVLKNGEECIPGQWKHEESGWVMTTVLPPVKADSNTQIDNTGAERVQSTSKPKRSIFYLHGSGFQVPMCVPLLPLPSPTCSCYNDLLWSYLYSPIGLGNHQCYVALGIYWASLA